MRLVDMAERHVVELTAERRYVHAFLSSYYYTFAVVFGGYFAACSIEMRQQQHGHLLAVAVACLGGERVEETRHAVGKGFTFGQFVTAQERHGQAHGHVVGILAPAKRYNHAVDVGSAVGIVPHVPAHENVVGGKQFARCLDTSCRIVIAGYYYDLQAGVFPCGAVQEIIVYLLCLGRRV